MLCGAEAEAEVYEIRIGLLSSSDGVRWINILKYLEIIFAMYLISTYIIICTPKVFAILNTVRNITRRESELI